MTAPSSEKEENELRPDPHKLLNTEVPHDSEQKMRLRCPLMQNTEIVVLVNNISYIISSVKMLFVTYMCIFYYIS